VVNRNHRNENIAGKLLIQWEEKASALGIHCMYLFTETAPDYFAKKDMEK
jgi:N-acetylglutamate synthase-like GNAT family acetyltransferase